jgi:hypothetical protein
MKKLEEIVRAGHEAFDRGDLDSVLDPVTEDVAAKGAGRSPPSVGRMMRGMVALLLSTVALAAPAEQALAQDATTGQTSALCLFTAHVVATPGWTLTPGSGHGETATPGSLSCVGTVGGSQISTQAGSISYRFAYGTIGAGLVRWSAIAL